MALKTTKQLHPNLSTIMLKFTLTEQGKNILNSNKRHYTLNFPWIDLESDTISVYNLTYLGELRDHIIVCQ